MSKLQGFRPTRPRINMAENKENREAKSNIQKAKKSISNSKNITEEHIKSFKSLYGKLNYAECFLTEQERLLNENAIVPDDYTSSAVAIANSGSILEGDLIKCQKNISPYIQKIEERANLIFETTTSTMHLLFNERGINKNHLVPYNEYVIQWEELRQKITSIEPNLEKMVTGAISALDDPNPDNIRQACQSLRELLTHLFDILAPNDEVKKAEWYKPVLTSKTKVSRRQRLKYIAFGSLIETTDDNLDIIELVTETLILNDEIIAQTHKLDLKSVKEINPIIAGFCNNLIKLLEIHEQRVNS